MFHEWILCISQFLLLGCRTYFKTGSTITICINWSTIIPCGGPSFTWSSDPFKWPDRLETANGLPSALFRHSINKVKSISRILGCFSHKRDSWHFWRDVKPERIYDSCDLGGMIAIVLCLLRNSLLESPLLPHPLTNILLTCHIVQLAIAYEIGPILAIRYSRVKSPNNIQQLIHHVHENGIHRNSDRGMNAYSLRRGLLIVAEFNQLSDSGIQNVSIHRRGAVDVCLH